MNVPNKKLPNPTISPVYNFYRFYVITEKPTGGRGKRWVKMHTTLRLGLSFAFFDKTTPIPFFLECALPVSN